MKVSRPHPEEARSAVSKDESHRALMVRDGARAPPHHEGESRARFSSAVRACIRISNSQNAKQSRHCEERSDEAIHSFFVLRYGLLRFARNDVVLSDTPSHSRDAKRPNHARIFRPKEGVGNAGCALHPRSRAQRKVGVHARAYRLSGGTRHSRTRWF
jgi:hypothetical protein